MLWRSADAGLTWAAANLGAAPVYAGDLLVDPSDPRTIYLVPDALDPVPNRPFAGKVRRSSDGGMTWQELPLVVAERGVLAMTAARPGTLFYLDSNGHVLQVKADDGTMVADLGVPPGAVQLMFDPKETDLLYTAGAALYRRNLP